MLKFHSLSFHVEPICGKESKYPRTWDGSKVCISCHFMQSLQWHTPPYHCELENFFLFSEELTYLLALR